MLDFDADLLTEHLECWTVDYLVFVGLNNFEHFVDDLGSLHK